MYVHNLQHGVRTLVRPGVAAGVLFAFALLSACSNDSASRINAPPSLFSANNPQSAAASAPSLGAASNFAILSAASGGGGAVTCVNTPPPTTIIGDVGSSGLPASVVNGGCTINGAIIAPVSAQVLADFNGAYDALAGESCDTFLTGTLAGVTLTPGVYCFAAEAALTGTLTLSGGPGDTWLFKVGTSGTGALTGTNFNVVMSGGDPCNVTWWVAEAATMTTSKFIGTILAGAAITVTSGGVGTFTGRALAKKRRPHSRAFHRKKS